MLSLAGLKIAGACWLESIKGAVPAQNRREGCPGADTLLPADDVHLHETGCLTYQPHTRYKGLQIPFQKPLVFGIARHNIYTLARHCS